MSLLTVERSQSVEGFLSSSSEEESDDHEDGIVAEDDRVPHQSRRHPKLGRMRSPSFAGYFASRGGAVYLPDGKETRTATESHENICGDLQLHLQEMVALLREEDSLKMAVRIESQLPDKKRYLTAVTNANDQWILIGVDWDRGPTIGVVLELHSSTITKLDGDGGFHISYETEITHCFKPVSVQTLWSAMHIIQKGIDAAKGIGKARSYSQFASFYKSKINSNPTSISEWNMMDDLLSTRQFDMVLSDQEQSERAVVKKLIRSKLKEVMIRVDLDVITCRQIRNICEDELGMDLTEFKSYLDSEMLTILGQMDSASKIFDYLYLGSEWNASDLEQLQALGIGHILNLTREIDNFFPDTFRYYNVRVYDEEDTELLQYWDRTYRFIHNARLAGSKVLVHCRRGISRSASSVIAYIMKSHGWPLTESMEYVKKCRSIIEPNAGFQKQLIIYEGILNSSRHRHSDLFRQRSKSEANPPSTRERRKMFRNTKLGREIDEEEEKGDGEEEARSSKRPKSWTPDASKEFGDVGERHGEVASKIPSAISEVAPLGGEEDIEDGKVLEGQEHKGGMKGNLDSGDGAKAQRLERRRMLSRAKTLPSQLMTVGRMNIGSRLPDESASTEAEEAKEDDLVEQAVAASVMKRKMLRSLEQLQGLRQTKEILDNQFSVESIIRPSSLRKASFSRRLPFERTKSFSEEAESSRRQRIRDRAYTVGASKYFHHGSVDGEFSDGPDDESDKHNGDATNGNQADAAMSDRTDSITDGADRNRDDVILKEGEAIATRQVPEREEDGSVVGREDRSLANSVSIVTNSEGLAQNCGSDSAIDVSRVVNVKEATKLIEEQEKVLAQRGRVLRYPRRHTIGESKIWKEIIREDSISKPEYSQDPSADMRRDSKSEPCTEADNELSLPSDGLSGGNDDPDKRISSKLQKHNSFSGGIVSRKVHVQPSECDPDASSDQDISVKKLVEKHIALIRHSSPPGSLERPTTSSDQAVPCIAQDERGLAGSSSMAADEGCAESALEESQGELPNQGKLSDVVAPGLVKRHSRIFSQGMDKATEPMTDWLAQEPTTDGPLERPKRISDTKRLQEFEGGQNVRFPRPVSLNFEKGIKELADVNAGEEVPVGLCLPNDSMLKTISAPPSPNPCSGSRDRRVLGKDSGPQGVGVGRSSSMNDVTDFEAVARYSRDVFVSLPNSETPCEDVNSLVGRFEGTALAP